ncbi:MAG: hypothetical protein GXP62_17325 [Oligoflexia bacterium]|nr:hypothetical protein [Oligoflexia bacterium]
MTTARNPWSHVLDTGEHNDRADILGVVPGANRRWRKLTATLDVDGVVQLANVLYNRCDPKDLRTKAGPTIDRQAITAWDSLEKAVVKPLTPGTRWQKAAEKMGADGDQGLIAFRKLDLDHGVTACMRLVSGPYRWR